MKNQSTPAHRAAAPREPWQSDRRPDRTALYNGIARPKRPRLRAGRRYCPSDSYTRASLPCNFRCPATPRKNPPATPSRSQNIGKLATKSFCRLYSIRWPLICGWHELLQEPAVQWRVYQMSCPPRHAVATTMTLRSLRRRGKSVSVW